MGKVLVKCVKGVDLIGEEQTKYCQGVGKLLHTMRWSRPELYNATRQLSRFMTLGASGPHIKAMLRVMEYCVATEKRGLKLEPHKKVNGDPEFKLVILGRPYLDSRRSVSGNSTFLCGAPVMQRSNMQKIVALSATETAK
jgi:hypothetical protein